MQDPWNIFNSSTKESELNALKSYFSLVPAIHSKNQKYKTHLIAVYDELIFPLTDSLASSIVLKNFQSSVAYTRFHTIIILYFSNITSLNSRKNPSAPSLHHALMFLENVPDLYYSNSYNCNNLFALNALLENTKKRIYDSANIISDFIPLKGYNYNDLDRILYIYEKNVNVVKNSVHVNTVLDSIDFSNNDQFNDVGIKPDDTEYVIDSNGTKHNCSRKNIDSDVIMEVISSESSPHIYSPSPTYDTAFLPTSANLIMFFDCNRDKKILRQKKSAFKNVTKAYSTMEKPTVVISLVSCGGKSAIQKFQELSCGSLFYRYKLHNNFKALTVTFPESCFFEETLITDLENEFFFAIISETIRFDNMFQQCHVFTPKKYEDSVGIFISIWNQFTHELLKGSAFIFFNDADNPFRDISIIIIHKDNHISVNNYLSLESSCVDFSEIFKCPAFNKITIQYFYSRNIRGNLDKPSIFYECRDFIFVTIFTFGATIDVQERINLGEYEFTDMASKMNNFYNKPSRGLFENLRLLILQNSTEFRSYSKNTSD